MKNLIAFVCLAFVVAPSSALAVLPPGAGEGLKKNAPDVLTVKITKVEIKPTKGVFQPIIYTADVLKIDRSKSGRKIKDTIKIASYRLPPGSPPLAGPKIPPLLKAGWSGIAYLKKAKEDEPHQLAAYGHSFAPVIKR